MPPKMNANGIKPFQSSQKWGSTGFRLDEEKHSKMFYFIKTDARQRHKKTYNVLPP